VPDSGGNHFNAIGPEVSADGKFVAFIASTGLPGQDNHLGTASVELYNVATHETTDISADAKTFLLNEGATSISFDSLPSLSADGGLVVFQGHFQLNSSDESDVFLYNAQTQTTSLVLANGGSAVISGNGQFIASEGNADQIFGTHVLVMNDSGTVLTEIRGNDPSFVPPLGGSSIDPDSVYNPAISNDGRFVTFWSTSKEIDVTDNTTQPKPTTYVFHTGNTSETNAQVYVYDSVNHTLTEISAANPGTISNGGTFAGTPGNGNSGTLSITDQNNNDGWASSMSADGHLVVFQSTADNLVSGVGDANHDVSNIFLYDTQTGKIVALTDANGTTVTGGSIRPQISADGSYVTFASEASDLTGANGGAQTYIVQIDPTTGKAVGGPQLLSTGFTGTDNGQNDLGNAASSGDTIAAFGGAVLALNFDNGIQPQVNGNTVKFFGGSITAYNTTDTLTLTVSVTNGTLKAANNLDLTSLGLTVVHDGSNGTLEVTGSLAALDTAVNNGVVYTTSSPNTSYSDTLAVTLTDQHNDTATNATTFTANGSTDTISSTSSGSGQYDVFLVDPSTGATTTSFSAPTAAVTGVADVPHVGSAISVGTTTENVAVTLCGLSLV
jgi:hypothetical protein